MFSGGIAFSAVHPNIFRIVIGMYFLNLLKINKVARLQCKKSKVELDKLQSMRSIKLTEPLTAKQGQHTLKK